MLHTLSERIADFLFDEKDEYPLEVYTYGFELILSSVVELIVLLIIGAMLKQFIETIIFILVFCILRIFTGGYHAKTYIKCSITTVVTFLSVMVNYKFILTYDFKCILLISIIVFIFSFYVIRKFAPINNKNKDVYDGKRLKLIAFICLLLYAAIVLLFSILLKFDQTLIIIPTILSVDILMLVEIIRKRCDKNEKYSENIIERAECEGK